jgi:acyl-coenzyme A thioesterase PaaI-like protein
LGVDSAGLRAGLRRAHHVARRSRVPLLTLETKFVRPISRETGVVRCETDVLHRGRQQATAEARAVDWGGKLLALRTATCIIFGG